MFFGSKRKNYLINPKFQLSFILFSILTSFFGMAVFYGAIKYFFWTFKNMGKEVGIPENHIFFTFLDDQSTKMNYIFIISAFVFFLISLIGSLLLSHKVAGPIYRLTKYLKESSKESQTPEELSKLQFRKGDFFLELQDAFNDFIENFKPKG